jgi:hypothetical protein
MILIHGGRSGTKNDPESELVKLRVVWLAALSFVSP